MDSESVHPVSIARAEDGGLKIEWSDDWRQNVAAQELQDNCPCATCREKKKAPPSSPSGLAIVSVQETEPVTVEAMQPVGNYAYSIAFNRGCNKGIYTLEHLRRLGHLSRPESTA